MRHSLLELLASCSALTACARSSQVGRDPGVVGLLLSRFLSLLAVDRDYLYDCLLCAPSQGKRALGEELRKCHLLFVCAFLGGCVSFVESIVGAANSLCAPDKNSKFFCTLRLFPQIDIQPPKYRFPCVISGHTIFEVSAQHQTPTSLNASAKKTMKRFVPMLLASFCPLLASGAALLTTHF